MPMIVCDNLCTSMRQPPASPPPPRGHQPKLGGYHKPPNDADYGVYLAAFPCPCATPPPLSLRLSLSLSLHVCVCVFVINNGDPWTHVQQ